MPTKSITDSPDSKFNLTGESIPTSFTTTVNRSSEYSDSTPSPDIVTRKSVPPTIERFSGIANLASS